jgi:stage V sporulation protein G
MPGYMSRYDDLDGGEFDVAPLEAGSGGSLAGGEPPLRRGPLRSHTQHSRGGQSVLRGPHTGTRKEGEGVSSERGESAPGFGAGL